MSCEETQRLLHAYIDAELDMVNSLKVEQHLQQCAACRLSCENYQAVRTAIQGEALYFRAPAPLQKRVQLSLPKTDPALRIARVNSWRWLGAAALVLLLLGGLGFWGFTLLRPGPVEDNHMAQAVLDSHERSLMDNHLVDILSSDQQTVKTWFAGKLGFSPPVVDLTPQGFSLVGGRLDFINGQTVAVIVYKWGPHVINLFVWPSTLNTDIRTLTLRGYYLTHWTKYNLDCWAVSDLDENELQQFAHQFDQHFETLL